MVTQTGQATAVVYYLLVDLNVYRTYAFHWYWTWRSCRISFPSCMTALLNLKSVHDWPVESREV